jgi:hypothetical protein
MFPDKISPIREIKHIYFSKDANKVVLTNKSNNSDAIKYSKIPINVTMDVIPDETDDNGTTFKITTNLPNETNLLVEISNIGSDFPYDSQCNINVNNGSAETESFTSNQHSLPNGDYRIEINVPIESVQDSKNARKLLGKNSSNLQGDYARDADDGESKTIKFVKKIKNNKKISYDNK